LPQAVGQPQYNPATGAFSYPFNFTNPLSTQLSISQLSAEVVSGNNVTLGNVSINPINIAPGASAIINATGTLSQNEVNQLEAQYQSGSLNVSLENVNVDVGGISVHINQISNIGSIPNIG
jgi:preprotein translocase subunit SecD